MSEDSKIEWTKHTFNPWSGCTKISAGCANCYAAATPPSMRRGAEWGDGRERKPASDSYWRQPLAWNRAAEKAGERHRVFCASMADVFEDRADLDPWRERLFALIGQTPALDWLLLTKRPQVATLWSETIAALPNIWIGTSVENQQAADDRIPWLLQVPARVRFLSMEPLLGAVDLTRLRPPDATWLDCLEGREHIGRSTTAGGPRIHWVIVGGESGHRARPMHPDWARGVRDQCKAAGVPFFFKQWGEYAPIADDEAPIPADARLVDPIHGDVTSRTTLILSEAGDRPRQIDIGETVMVRVGKKAAGRELDGRTWDQFPS